MTTSSLMVGASRIALALGKTKRGVQLALSRTPADGVILVRGQQADAWRLTSLPHRMVQEMDTVAARRGYRDAEHLLADPPKRFVPVDKNGKEVPVAQIAQPLIDRAHRLRRALAPTLELRDRLTSEESKQLALSSFRREWGNCSERTWERKLRRVLQRDAGEERFEDIALYFDEVVTRRPEARERIAIGSTAGERTVLEELARPKDLANPTLQEKALIWETIVHFIDDSIESGTKPKRAFRRAFELITGSRVSLSKSDDALKRLIKEKFSGWIAKGRRFVALEDQRPKNSGPRAPEINETDRTKIIAHAVKSCGGRLSQAYRELLQAGELSLNLTSRFLDNAASKSYVPRAIRRATAHDVRRLAAYHHGEREHELRGAYHTRDWPKVMAGDWFQSDDLTSPVYFYKLNGSAIEITRGQFLPMIDERTGIVLGFDLIQEKSYNSLSIRSLITNVCAIHGLPRRGFAFEGGIWKSSKILAGNRNADLDGIADTGLRRLGMRMRHARLPRAKVVERLLGQLQDRMEGLPGYCGRNELTDRFERLQRAKLDVEAGRADVREHFLSAEEIKAEYARLIDRYNHEPQEGKRLNGLSPAEGWAQLQGDEPRMRFDDRLLYFLASELRRLKIGRNGLTIAVGKQRFNYKGTETGARVGETVFAWFNPARPDLLTCTTDLNGSGVFTVERSFDLPAVDASRELMAEENRKVRDHNRYARDLYHVIGNPLPPCAFRGQVASARMLALGEEMAAQQEGKRARQSDRETLNARIVRAAKRAGKSPSLVPLSEQALEGLEMLAEAKAEMERQKTST